ncbi:hypothetical protein HYN59_11260 [Flavobacterium album]|uniref:Uncharacterized protein n=1 Tax=Flavobacterium album TaxID=2175091 RepID=A0A2S1QZ26_9FLAO|nr:hypothetical protein HYN59_11260 [Flavobacterium album]
MGCKPLEWENTQYTKNCFYRENGYIFLNFYNSADKDIFVSEISVPLNKDFTLIDHYYKIKSDALYMRTPDENDVSISDVREPNIKIIRDSIEIKKGKNYKRVFKLNKDFKTIVFKNGDDSFILENCN